MNYPSHNSERHIGHRFKVKEIEEDKPVFTLDEWERRKAGAIPGVRGEPLDLSRGELFARLFQNQFNLEDQSYPVADSQQEVLIITPAFVLDKGKPGFTKKQADLFFPPDFNDDFPVSMQISQKYGLIYVITKLGLLFVSNLETASAVYRNRISPDPIFWTSEASSSGGFYAINRRGQVLLANVNEATIITFVSGQLNNFELAVNLAKRGNLPGAENLIVWRHIVLRLISLCIMSCPAAKGAVNVGWIFLRCFKFWTLLDLETQTWTCSLPFAAKLTEPLRKFFYVSKTA